MDFNENRVYVFNIFTCLVDVFFITMSNNQVFYRFKAFLIFQLFVFSYTQTN